MLKYLRMRKLLWILLLLFLASVATAEIFEPADKLRTYSEVIMLRGRTEGPGPLEVNGQMIKVSPDNTFSCGLIMKPGKNLVEVRRGGARQRIRILRLVTYPDIEELYGGEKHWAWSQIVYLSTVGIIEGYPDLNFYPGNPVTRGELATWLARVKQLPIPKLTEDVFFDVPKEHWRAPFIKAAVTAGYMKGYSREIFGIDDPVSRREAAEIAVIIEGLGIIEKIKPLFKDVPEAEKGAPPIYTAQERGLVIGVSRDIPIYEPGRALTRAEAAMLLSRFTYAQQSFRYLVDFEAGYTNERLCDLNVPPEILSFTVEPREITLKKTTTIKLRAWIAAREKFSPIAKVKMDLSKIGGLPDAEMFDDGTHGDDVSGDRIYSLNISFSPEQSGEYALEVTATDLLGWEGKKQATILILE